MERELSFTESLHWTRCSCVHFWCDCFSCKSLCFCDLPPLSCMLTVASGENRHAVYLSRCISAVAQMKPNSKSSRGKQSLMRLGAVGCAGVQHCNHSEEYGLYVSSKLHVFFCFFDECKLQVMLPLVLPVVHCSARGAGSWRCLIFIQKLKASMLQFSHQRNQSLWPDLKPGTKSSNSTESTVQPVSNYPN